MKIFELILLIVFCNIVPLWTETDFSAALKIIATVVLSAAFLCVLIHDEKTSVKSRRLSSLKRGTTLLWLSGMAIIPEIIIIVLYFIKSDAGVLPRIFSIVMPLLAVGITFLDGFIRTAVGSKQIKASDYILLLIFWWIPVVNIVLIRRFYKTAKREYFFELSKAELESARAENEICKTKYPIVMVHGIFFRDWQYMNYWGRVPATLIRNGAKVYYGNQQSAKSIPESAAELKTQIEAVLAETGAEKVNIIAHSKGGLDSRYAISSLGLGDRVATLTTINTPHKGSDMVDYLLKKIPDGMVKWIAERYNSIFRKLGDKEPDFLAGVGDLSPVRLKELAPLMEDHPDVSYRSCMSVMKNVFSAGIPLNIGYLLIKKLNGRS
ncbi:MAG: triacylglycerol lipase, partial [Planctomycetia bacterium]|nr:triacylglycerol lipase [Planctomycetia bacterium]